MTKVARYMKFTAKPGETDKLAALLSSAAEELADTPGCELYLVNRQADAPETVWVTELWRSQADVDASIANLKDDPKVAEVMSLVASAERIDLEPVGGKAPAWHQRDSSHPDGHREPLPGQESIAQRSPRGRWPTRPSDRVASETAESRRAVSWTGRPRV